MFSSSKLLVFVSSCFDPSLIVSPQLFCNVVAKPSNNSVVSLVALPTATKLSTQLNCCTRVASKRRPWYGWSLVLSRSAVSTGMRPSAPATLVPVMPPRVRCLNLVAVVVVVMGDLWKRLEA